jgi:hypothetical protein
MGEIWGKVGPAREPFPSLQLGNNRLKKITIQTKTLAGIH